MSAEDTPLFYSSSELFDLPNTALDEADVDVACGWVKVNAVNFGNSQVGIP